MEAPDKIYLHRDIGGQEFIRPWLRRAANSESVAYIRKDALLEWAKETKNALEKDNSIENNIRNGALWELEEVINKIESL